MHYTITPSDHLRRLLTWSFIRPRVALCNHEPDGIVGEAVAVVELRGCLNEVRVPVRQSVADPGFF